MAEPDRRLDLDRPRAVHIVGVGGAGMSAIATVLRAMGHSVTGSDLKESTGLERLRAQGVAVTVGHAAANVGAVDALAVSTAVPERNPEVVAARERGIPVLRRADVLAAICGAKRTIAVSGTHGKTTTTSMLALVLVASGAHPSFIVGGEVNEIGGGAAWAGGEWFVVEADESDGTFLDLPAEVAVVTSVEADHLDHYGSMAAIEAAFERFVGAAARAIVCADEPVAARIGRAAGAVTYGTTAGADYQIVDLELARTRTHFRIVHDGRELATVTLPVPGAHNARNATAALATAVEIGLPVEAAVASLARFGGVARRFQFRGEAAGVTVVDDYAHNPGKVEAVLDAAGHGGWERVVCVFQPHRYSRTAALGRDIGIALRAADVVVVTDVYGAGEAPRPGVTGMLVADAAIDARPWRRLAYLPRRSDVVAYLRGVLRPGDLCLTLGAGDITSLPDEILPMLAAAPSVTTVDRAAAILGDRARVGVPLGPLTTYRVGGPAALFVTAARVDDLLVAADAVSATGIDVVVVGKGSNLLVADAGFDGLAIVLGDAFAGVEIDPAGAVVRAGGAAATPVVSRRTAAAGLTGFEWAVGVPGSIGGAVRMNAGGHGSDMARVLRGVRVVRLDGGEDGWVPVADLDLAYRHSAIGPSDVVVHAEIALAVAADRAAPERAIADIVKWRRDNQPGGQNAGSVFTNPPADSAGRLIDAAGLKGHARGTARVSAKHANFFIADEGGRADDVYGLMVEVQRRVAEATGTVLVPETAPCRVPTVPRRRSVTAPTDTRPDAGPEAPARIDPRIRARRIAVRRDEGRKRLYRLIGVAVVALLALAAVGATRSPLLDVDQVEVVGAYHVLPDDILHAGAVRRGSAMTDLDTGAVRARVATLPWIGTVSVTRHWPGTVRISVIERQPVATVAGGTDRWALVDRTGRILQVDPTPVAGYPELAGVDPAGDPGEMIGAAAHDLLSVAHALPAPLAVRVRAIGSDDSGLTLALTTCGIVRVGDTTDLAAKLVAAETVLEDVPLDLPGQALAVLDVRVPTAPVLTHDPNCANVSTATGG